MNIICGINPVLEALASGARHFDRLLVAKGLRNKRVAEAMRLASQRGVPLRFETRETLDRMSGDVPHQGVVGVVSAKPVMSLEALLQQARAPELIVVLDGVEDPRNLGAILRTVEAAGADGVLLPERHSAGLSETVARASAGGLEHVKVARIGNVVQALEALKERGLWVIGYDAAGSERWDSIDCTGPVALVFGGEGRGIRRLVREKCDHVASLPLFGHVSSLNVSVVAAIALYEAVRQRRAQPSHVRPIPVAPSRPATGEAAPGGSWEEDEDIEPPERPLALVHIEEHDATAWSHPVVLHNVGPGGRRRQRGEDRRLHPRNARRGAAAARDGASRPAGGQATSPRAGGKRRRRGRGPGQGRPAGQGHGARESGPPPEGPSNAAGPGANAPAPASQGGPPAAGHRKGRRHRRRRGRPPAGQGGSGQA
jgi:23S rRNA (guanosine2251-2'-O)-methyltransferase